MNLAIFKQDTERLDLFEKLKQNYFFNNENFLKQENFLDDCLAIGLRTYFKTDKEQSTLSKLLQPIQKTQTKQVTEQITYFVNKGLATPKKPELFEYNEIITATHMFQLTTTYQTELIRKIGRIPKNNITKTNHETYYKKLDSPQGKINIKKINETEFIYYLNKQLLEKIQQYTK